MREFSKEDDPEGLLRKLFLDIAPTGSTVICGDNPATLPNDEDWVCLAPPGRLWSDDERFGVSRVLARHGFVAESLASYDEDVEPTEDVRQLPINVNFGSWRRMGLNLIVTEKPMFFARFVIATALAKQLSLQQKAHRINLFKAVLYGAGDEAIVTALAGIDIKFTILRGMDLTPRRYEDEDGPICGDRLENY